MGTGGCYIGKQVLLSVRNLEVSVKESLGM